MTETTAENLSTKRTPDANFTHRNQIKRILLVQRQP